jgi:hypothetical protein
VSLDLDFFSAQPLDRQTVWRALPWLAKAEQKHGHIHPLS